MDKRYQAFMLRLWQVGDDDRLCWRASLECPSTGELCGFASLDELCSYLRALTDPEECEQGEGSARPPAAGTAQPDDSPPRPS